MTDKLIRIYLATVADILQTGLEVGECLNHQSRLDLFGYECSGEIHIQVGIEDHNNLGVAIFARKVKNKLRSLRAYKMLIGFTLASCRQYNRTGTE